MRWTTVDKQDREKAGEINEADEKKNILLGKMPTCYFQKNLNYRKLRFISKSFGWREASKLKWDTYKGNKV